jgi:hypothetical protein
VSEDNNKLISISGGKKREEVPLLNYVKITYTDGEVEVVQSDSWGSANEIENYLVFFRTIDKDTDVLTGFRNQNLIKKIEMIKEDGSNV